MRLQLRHPTGHNGLCIRSTPRVSLTTTNSIVVFLVVVSVVDMVSFRGGPTAWILDAYRTGTNELLLHLALTFPVRGHMVPLIGVRDLVVMSALIEATRRLGYPTTEVALCPAGLRRTIC